MLEKTTPEFWRSITLGSTITLSDTQAILDAMEVGAGVEPTDYEVVDVEYMKDSNNIAEWVMFTIERGDDDDEVLFLLVKIVGEEVALRVYFLPPDFDAGTRKDLIDSDMYWMFEEPEDPNTFKYTSLEFAKVLCFEDEGGEGETQYERKLPTLYGTIESRDEFGDEEEMFMAITEYETDSPIENKEALVLERGGENSEDGGYVNLYIGTNISPAEVDVLILKEEH